MGGKHNDDDDDDIYSLRTFLISFFYTVLLYKLFYRHRFLGTRLFELLRARELRVEVK